MHNAIRYTPAGGSITVAVRIEGDRVCAEVCDSGPGIAVCRRNSVFERFAQVADADADPKTRQTPGAGLGLSIARAYARRNGGDIELADGDGAGGAPGLRALLRFPLARVDTTMPA